MLPEKLATACNELGCTSLLYDDIIADLAKERGISFAEAAHIYWTRIYSPMEDWQNHD